MALYLPPAAGAGWFDKAGLRAAFSPSRLALALQEADDGLRAAATGAGLPARRLAAVEAWCRAQGTHTLSTGLPTGLSTAAARALRAACGADLPEDAARAELAARLVAGRLGRPAEVPAA